MGRRAWAVAASLALGLGLAGPAEASRPTISGTVTAYATGQALEGMVVCATSRPNGRHRVCADTDANGRYRMSVPSASYHLRASDPYRYGEWTDRVWPGGELDVTRRDRVANFAMRAGARVRLDLRATAGRLEAEYLAVRPYRLGADGRLHAIGDIIESVVPHTDRMTGSVELAKLPRGRYTFRLESGDGGRNHAESWWAGTGSARAARLVDLAPGDDVTLPGTWPVQPPSSLAVKVAQPGGGIATSTVQLYDATGREVAGHDLRRRNVTTFHGLAPGRYRVKVSENRRATDYVEWHPSGTRFSQARDVVVGEGVDQRLLTRLEWPSLRRLNRPVLQRSHIELSTSDGRWSPRAERFRYTWYRDGTILHRQKYPSLVLGRASRGSRFQVCVTALRSGYGNARSCSRVATMPTDGY